MEPHMEPHMEHDLIVDNPHLKKPTLAVLGLFEGDEPLRRNDVEARAAEGWEASFAHNPTVVVDILVRTRALAEQTYVNGEPYPGTLEDVQTDENVPDDAEAWTSLSITEKGRDLLERHTPANALYALFDEKPEHADVFRAVLWACDTDEGCPRAELEKQIDEVAGPQDPRAKVYPQYFIDALETAGGIAWDGAWKTTPAGRAFVAD
jgi:hypothetical protein